MCHDRLAAHVMVFGTFLATGPYLRGAALLPAQAGQEQAEPAYVQPVPVLVDRDTIFQEVTVLPGGQVVPGDDGGVADGDSRLIYSNTLSINTINFPANQPVSDDIATLAPDGCNLKMFRFKVLGKVLATGSGGPFTVKYALYTNCPLAMGGGANGVAMRELIKIPGATGEISFPDDTPRTIKHVVDSHNPVPIQTNFYLGLQFNRGNCGTVIGAPAEVGFSADQWDFPGFPCNGFLGGSPQLPHASFWAEVYGDAACPASFPGYKAARASGGQALIGANVQGVDDVKLEVQSCLMVGYEVVVKGVGFYTFDLRRQCNGQIIPGTERTFQVTAGTTPQLQVARFTFGPPILIEGENLYLGFKVSSNSSGAVIAGIQPVIGQSSTDYYTVGLDGCQPVPPSSGVHGAINLAITCAGTLPAGACCDMALLECHGGLDAGKRCPGNAFCIGGPDNGHACTPSNPCDPPGICTPYCASSGTCEAVCRELPQMNCAWPPKNQLAHPAWAEGAQCEPDPFELPCGKAACCEPNDTCENLTQNECNAVDPIDTPRLWQAGVYCQDDWQSCPYHACLVRDGECLISHDGTGCSDPLCCSDVCDHDPWCCLVDWDRLCADYAGEVCHTVLNDGCLPTSQWDRGALELTNNIPLRRNNLFAAESDTDAGYCCNAIAPDGPGFGTVWFKFLATADSAEIDTCFSDPSGDTVINVLSPADQSSQFASCNSLNLIGCGDDGCGSTGKHANLCVGGLTPGVTYYIMLASKTKESKGMYQIRLKSPALCDNFWVGGDCNHNGSTDGCDLIDGTSADCDDNLIPDECAMPQLGSVASESCVRFGQTVYNRNNADGPGLSISMNDEWLFVGDPTESTSDVEQVGAVYAYRRSGSAWVLHQTLTTPPCSDSYCRFGSSVAVSVPVAIVVGYDVAVRAKTYSYLLENDSWGFQGEFEPPPESNHMWLSVKMDGDMAALAAISYGIGYECSFSIAVFMYRHIGGSWQLEGRVPGTGSFGECNFAMDLRDGALAITSEHEYDDNHNWIGGESIQVFERRGPDWTRTARFGFPKYSLFPIISVRGNMVVGAGIEQNSQGQYVSVGHVFSRSADGWRPETVIRDPDAAEYFTANAMAMCHGGLVAMVATGSDAPCARILFTQRGSDGTWKEVCDFPFPSCFVSSQGLAQIVCSKDVAAIAIDSSDDGSVFTSNIPSTDCDANLVPDACDLADGIVEDCNLDFTPDQCAPLLGNDADFSGRIDLRDVGVLQNCFASPGAALKSCCGVFDADQKDGDVDGTDVAAFVAAMTGP